MIRDRRIQVHAVSHDLDDAAASFSKWNQDSKEGGRATERSSRDLERSDVRLLVEPTSTERKKP